MRKINLFRKIIICAAVFLFLVAFFWSVITTRKEYMEIYKNGTSLVDSGHYQEGLQILMNLGDYQESRKYIGYALDGIKFDKAEASFYMGDLDAAKGVFSELAEKTDFKRANDAKEYVEKINKIQSGWDPRRSDYDEANQLFEAGDYAKALNIYKDLGEYEQSKAMAEKCDIAIKILRNSKTISTGTQISAGITQDGTVNSCGFNPIAKEIENWEDIISISVFGSLAIGLKIDGTVVTAGELKNSATNDQYRIETGNWDDIVSVSAGDLYIVGLRSNGTLVAQGYSGDHQMDIDEWTNVKAIDTGWRHTVGLTNDGKVLIAGLRHKDEELIKQNPEEWHDIIMVAAGGGAPGKPGEQGHTVGLRSDGTVVAIGDNGRGQCNVNGPEWQNIVYIAAGGFHTVGLTRDGDVVTTNEYANKEIEKWKEDSYKMVAIAAGYGTTFALDTDGVVHSTGYFLQDQQKAENWGKLAIHKEEWESILPNVQ